MMVIGRLRPDTKSKHGTKSGRPRTPLSDRVSPLHLKSSSTTEYPSASLFEALPSELLQDIFLFSANLNLPLCSKQLMAALTSQHLKFEVTLQILVQQSDTLDQENKSQLLSRKFFTWEFLIRYVSFAQTRIHPAVGGDKPEDEVGSDEDERRAAVTECSVNTGPPRAKRTQQHPAKLADLDRKLTFLTQKSIVELRHAEDRYSMEVSDSAVSALEQLHQIRSLKGLKGLHLPEKLIHNNWDDDRRRLLRLLFAFNCTVNTSSPAAIVAEEGIIAAIESGDEELVSFFLSHNIGVAPTAGMLRQAMKGMNISIVFQLLRAAGNDLEFLDPQLWMLLDEHTNWSKASKAKVKQWLRGNISSSLREEGAEFLPKVKDISVNANRWSSS
ncbi:uncharacterized protein PV09_00499 [Verruconis gallopava]|uniref:Uncharacterized protein n=1 Tax=Verruconis gallopava TaxID=253628 RepID=A0A0D2BE20_9PEZI|nr:uncharacterized protein PV09_00499 [Verruconis gallopava]KIW09634.1 hypothetical protein PV09_00499 [Verruconis gallopava]